MSHVRGSKRNPSAEERPVILALEYRKFDASSSVRRPSIPRPRIPKHPFTSFAAQLSPFIVTIKTGEDIGKRIRDFFQERIHPRCGALSVEGCIYTVSGDISNPRIDIKGVATYFEGNFSIATLQGRFVICNNGHVQLDYLKVGFQPDDVFVCGTTIGPLIAGCAVQVSFSRTIVLRYVIN
ncbi:PREDICTED: uncharacterized protein LOC105953999 isoform X2 [Erythranthe guttata]|uniref:uncharacterized protein LOC105953999 isoform X2 n=1 Tax=Erythranthe guttata TaxID=4155 RepID=UPI00064D87C4|nr:PREDICTED: uncharacterized protein LOC105953999 isoform X2 [Erythranthe guttata]|eukprot:XP_012833126.1 PREDICTED: uncharacterized protein LOC105953999 isoform X2 [Erythranthe guttata]